MLGLKKRLAALRVSRTQRLKSALGLKPTFRSVSTNVRLVHSRHMSMRHQSGPAQVDAREVVAEAIVEKVGLLSLFQHALGLAFALGGSELVQLLLAH